MTLSSLHLEAFSEVAKTRSFSKAAKNLHVTQSALSQRIHNLELELATGLVVRDPAGLRLTPSGEELLRYCHVKETLEEEVLKRISSTQTELGGVLRIAGFSSVMRSVVMPALDPFLKKHTSVHLEVFTREIRDLSKILSNNEADLIVTTEESVRQDIISHCLGYEINVLVESTQIADERKDVYLDHDPEDLTTSQFFKLNGQSSKKLQRSYLDEVYAIIDGAKRGWGRAVLPQHLVKKEKCLRVIKNQKPLKIPVLMQYFNQPYYSELFTTVTSELQKKCSDFLT